MIPVALGVAVGILLLPFAAVGAMYWMLLFLRALRGLQASMRAFREEMQSYRLWRDAEAPPPRPPIAPPPDYGPEPLGEPGGATDRPDAPNPEDEEDARRRRYRGLPPWSPLPHAPVDSGPTEFKEPARPSGDYDDFEEREPEPTIAPGSKLNQPAPPGPG